MREPFTVMDVYPALKEVIPQLESVGKSRLAAVLSHRLYKVPWTTGNELLEELQRVVSEALESDAKDVPKPIRDQLHTILGAIDSHMKSLDGR